MPSTQLQDHIESEQLGVAEIAPEAPASPHTVEDEKTASSACKGKLAIPEESILREICDAMTCPINFHREGVQVRSAYRGFSIS